VSEKFIDFRTVKEHISIETVLHHYGVGGRLRRANKHTLRGTCPLPTHSSDTSKESFSAHTEKNIWACQSDSCAGARQGKKGGNILDFVSIMERCSIREAAEKLNEWFLSALPASSTTRKGSEPSEKKQHISEKKMDVREGESNKPLSFTLKDIDHTHPYLRARGVTEESAKQFGIGFFPGRGSMRNRIVIPIENEQGELIAYAGRAIDDSDPKYKFPSGFFKSHVLYNLHRSVVRKDIRVSTVIVVEGFFDCVNVHDAGFPCVALMGASLSLEQEELLCSTFTGVVLFFDGDDVGRAATDACLLRLGRKLWIKAVVLPQGKQPDQLTSQELQRMLSV
jgi:DNA primase